jgi:hypothetical protein
MENQKMNFMKDATGDTLEAFGRTASRTGADEKRFRAWHTVEAVHDFLQGHVEENLPSGRRPQMKPHDIHILPEVRRESATLETLHHGQAETDSSLTPQLNLKLCTTRCRMQYSQCTLGQRS